VGEQAGRTFTHTYVGRWLDGVVPREVGIQRAIAAAIGKRLGRPVGLDECGFTASETIAADLGLAYPTSVTGAVTAAAGLWQADLANVQALLTAPANVAAWNAASLSWLVSDTADERRVQEGGRRVGPADIEGVRSTTEMFDRLDGRHGGGHARRALIEFLRTDLAALLRGSYNGTVGCELFKVAAQSTLLGAWMSYDAGLYGLAQRYFVQALKLADAAGDRLLAAGVLDAMSHQANFLGNHREAANLARAARMGTAGVGSACSAAHFYAMEARALAMAGDASGCDKAMAGAVQEFERCKPEDDPADWFAYFDDAELAAELGHCNRDLGRAVDASVYATQSIGANGEYVRSDFFVTMVLADAYLGQGEIEQACNAALTALRIGGNLKSARCTAYVSSFRKRLMSMGPMIATRSFLEEVASARLSTMDI
jgi:tetratricopeptide (TPR) repeat protein